MARPEHGVKPRESSEVPGSDLRFERLAQVAGRWGGARRQQSPGGGRW